MPGETSIHLSAWICTSPAAAGKMYSGQGRFVTFDPSLQAQCFTVPLDKVFTTNGV
jgi:hypothetical protein